MCVCVTFSTQEISGCANFFFVFVTVVDRRLGVPLGDSMQTHANQWVIQAIVQSSLSFKQIILGNNNKLEFPTILTKAVLARRKTFVKFKEFKRLQIDGVNIVVNIVC